MRARPSLSSSLLLTTFLFVASSCSVDKEAFQAKVFTCNPGAADPACGTDSNGNKMACVAAQQLGGRNFCASTCDSSVLVPDDKNICIPSGPASAGVRSGARLKSCNPKVPGSCGANLSCLRTDLYAEEGICMDVSPCTLSSDCLDAVRSTCMGELIKDLYVSAGFESSQTYCLQSGCRANRTACSPGETCLRDVLPRDSKPADICVPNCDSNDNCPPNYLCIKSLYSKITPKVCAPGLVGLRCRSRLDCLVGDCVDTGVGFSVCTKTCENDNDCAKLDSEQGTFFCATHDNGKKYCQGSRAYTGGICVVDTDCPTGQICSWPSETARTGYCQFPCDGEGRCKSIAGVAHTCLPSIQVTNAEGKKEPKSVPACFPGYFGLPCVDDSQCMGPMVAGGARLLECKPVLAGLSLCTSLCQNDEDCRKNRLTKDGWCPAVDNQTAVCLPPRADGADCQKDTQCASKKCLTNVGKCDVTPGF